MEVDCQRPGTNPDLVKFPCNGPDTRSICVTVWNSRGFADILCACLLKGFRARPPEGLAAFSILAPSGQGDEESESNLSYG